MLVTIEANRVASLGRAELSDALERGQIVFFPRSPVPLPDAGELAFLREELPGALAKKNVSYYPTADRLTGVNDVKGVAARTHAVLRAHSTKVAEFLRRAMPDFMQGAQVGTSSFRPLQERGRHLSAHASNELVHVDAGAYGATHGDRILRFFVNVNPSEDRVWATRGSFADVYARWGEKAGLVVNGKGPRLAEGAGDRFFTGFLRATSKLGVPMAKVLDTSPYDRAMRKLHNFMKDDRAFIEARDGYEEFRFPPFSAWMVLTDGVSHACLEGQHALVDTFIVPLASCRLKELAPFHLLQESPENAAKTRAA